MMILQELLMKGQCGMMPHPERALETLLGTDSDEIIEAMVKSWREQHV